MSLPPLQGVCVLPAPRLLKYVNNSPAGRRAWAASRRSWTPRGFRWRWRWPCTAWGWVGGSHSRSTTKGSHDSETSYGGASARWQSEIWQKRGEEMSLCKKISPKALHLLFEFRKDNSKLGSTYPNVVHICQALEAAQWWYLWSFLRFGTSSPDRELSLPLVTNSLNQVNSTRDSSVEESNDTARNMIEWNQWVKVAAAFLYFFFHLF